MAILTESVPFKPNIAELAHRMELSRESIYQYISQLTNAGLLNALTASGKGITLLQKPDKLYLENTNLSYALTARPDTGSLRETFLLNQLLNAGFEIKAPARGDFLLNDTAGNSRNRVNI